VQTGSQFGQEQNSISRLFSLLRDHQFLDAERMLDTPEEGSDSAKGSPEKQVLP